MFLKVSILFLISRILSTLCEALASSCGGYVTRQGTTALRCSTPSPIYLYISILYTLQQYPEVRYYYHWRAAPSFPSPLTACHLSAKHLSLRLCPFKQTFLSEQFELDAEFHLTDFIVDLVSATSMFGSALVCIVTHTLSKHNAFAQKQLLYRLKHH